MFRVDELLSASGGRLIRGSRGAIVKGVSIDSRTLKPGDVFIALKGDNFDGGDFIVEAIKKGAGCIIRQTLLKAKGGIGKANNCPFIEVKDALRALGRIAGFHRSRFRIPVIAVTGSCGKTTTKEMISSILSQSFNVLKNEGTKNNHIGVPLTLLELSRTHDIAVLELGTNHFGEIDYLSKICQPTIGVITNIGPSHLEHLKDLQGVYEEKCALIKNLIKPQIAVLNADDKFLRARLLKAAAKPFSVGFGFKHPDDFRMGFKRKTDFTGSDLRLGNEKVGFMLQGRFAIKLNTPGLGNIYNALAAIAVARILGVGYPQMSRALERFVLPPGRLNIVERKNVRFIDDTYNSNPAALHQALDILENFKVKGRRIFIMGDMLELGKRSRYFHRQAGRSAPFSSDVFITVGKLSKLAARAAKDLGYRLENIFVCESVAQAKDALFNKVIPSKDDIVLVKGSRAMRMEKIFSKL